MRSLGSIFLKCFLYAAIWFLPIRLSHAQYKNTMFSMHANFAQGWLAADDIDPGNYGRRPIRLYQGAGFGSEFDFKMQSDHWWFVPRINLQFKWFQQHDLPQDGTPLSPTQQFDNVARTKLNLAFTPQAMVGVRYYLLTDWVRPYIQFGISYAHIFVFDQEADRAPCVAVAGDNNPAAFCQSGGSYGDAFLRHRNVFGIHAEPGIEFILTRDIGLILFGDIQTWVVFIAPPTPYIHAGLGLTFYS